MNAKFTQILSLLVGLLVLSTSALYAQPANNECSGSIDISSLFDGGTNTSTLFDNTDATNEASDPALANGASCFFEGQINNTVWVSFVGDGNQYDIKSVQCNATNYITNGDTQFALYTGDCAGLTPVTDGCNEDGPGAANGNFFAQVTVSTVAGTTYYLMIDGYADANGSATGEFCLEITPFNVNTVCDAGSMTTTGAVQVNGTTETFDLLVEGFSIPNSPDQGGLYWLFLPSPDAGGGPFAGGGWGRGTSGSDTFTSTINGTVEAMTGTWEVYARATNTLDLNDVCDVTENFLTVLFDATPIVEECIAGTLTTNDTAFVDDVNTTFTITSIDRTIPFDGTVSGGYSWFFYPGPDGTGSGAFSFGIIGSESSTYTADLNGVLDNDLGGTWFVKGQMSSNASDIGDTPIGNAAATVCDVTTDSLTIIFPALDPGPCDAGSFVTTETQIVCPGDQVGVALQAGTDSIPLGGTLGWSFDNSVTGGTGGAVGGTLLTNVSSPAAYDNDLNGILSDNGLSRLEGAFVLRSAVLDAAGAVCSISSDSILVLFGDVVEDLQIIEDGLELTAFPGIDFMDFTYAWSTGEDTQVITVDASGDYTVTITDGIGCTTEATTTLVSTNEAEIVNSLSVSPNPTSGLLNVALDLPASQEVQLSLIDITGKEVMNLAPVTFTSRNFEVDLQDQAAGLYLLRFRIGNDVVTRRIVKK